MGNTRVIGSIWFGTIGITVKTCPDILSLIRFVINPTDITQVTATVDITLHRTGFHVHCRGLLYISLVTTAIDIVLDEGGSTDFIDFDCCGAYYYSLVTTTEDVQDTFG